MNSSPAPSLSAVIHLLAEAFSHTSSRLALSQLCSDIFFPHSLSLGKYLVILCFEVGSRGCSLSSNISDVTTDSANSLYLSFFLGTSNTVSCPWLCKSQMFLWRLLVIFGIRRLGVIFTLWVWDGLTQPLTGFSFYGGVVHDHYALNIRWELWVSDHHVTDPQRKYRFRLLIHWPCIHC